MPLHASCVAHHGDAVLLLGPAGVGKSDLALRLMGRGWDLVADDQVEVSADAGGLVASPPGPLAGMLEVRGIGLFRNLAHVSVARLRLAVTLLGPQEAPQRLPDPESFQALGHQLPRIMLRGLEASAPDRLVMALHAACGRASLAAGAFPAAPA